MANPNPTGNRYSSENQPKKKGRKKSIYGPLEKECSLSLDDIRKVYKNILTAKGTESLNKIKEKYPTILTDATIDMIKQDMAGRLTGKRFKIKLKDDDGNEIEKIIDERIKSYETIKYMLDRCFGEPAKADSSNNNEYEQPYFIMDELPE